MRRCALLLAACAALLLGTVAAPPPAVSAAARRYACDDAYADALALLRAGCAWRASARCVCPHVHAVVHPLCLAPDARAS
jgi:hypothetical protein